MFIILFLSISNTIISFPIDKLFFIVSLLYSFYSQKIKINKFAFVSILSICVLLVLLINVFSSSVSLMILFPIIGILFIILGVQKFNIEMVYRSLLVYIIIAFLYLVNGYVFNSSTHVHFLYDKGLPFLAAPMGFSTTVQTFGTICLSWIVIFDSKYRSSEIRTLDKLALVFVLLMTISTFNRVTYVNLFVFFTIYNPIIILYILLLLGVTFTMFPETITSLLGASGTVMSRFNYLKKYIQIVEQSNSFNQFFGHSNSIVTNRNALSISNNQPLIENGIFSIIFSFGFFFMFILVFILVIFIFLSKTKNCFKYRLFLSYFIIPAQVFTQEYYSTSFYFFILCYTLSYFKIKNIRKLGEI